MKIYIASDHAGFLLKSELMSFLHKQGYEVFDCGPESYNPTDDYPDFVSIVAKYVSEDPSIFGIVIGSSGQGEAMVANRFPGVRCALFYGGSKHILSLSREHNDANVLSLGAKFLTVSEAKTAVELWLQTKFSGDERHIRRIKKIEQITETL